MGGLGRFGRYEDNCTNKFTGADGAGGCGHGFLLMVAIPLLLMGGGAVWWWVA